MKVNIEILRHLYDYAVKTENIYFINHYIGIEEDKIATFEEFKDFIKSTIIADFQYDFGYTGDLNKLIEMED